MAIYDTGAQTVHTALEALNIAAQRITDYASTHTGQHMSCRIILDLPEPTTPDDDQPIPT
jgi:hypothetical protein